MTDYSDLKARLAMPWTIEEYMRDLNRKALAAIEELEARSQWQPIATAPKDGTEFLTYAKGNPKAMYERDREPAIVISKWKNDCFWRNRPDNMPTHWMPLPQPPETTNDRA